MIYCQIENGVVVNRATFDTPMPPDWPNFNMWVQNDEAQIGWHYTGGVFAEPARLPDPVMAPLTPPPGTSLMFAHENRLRALEGLPPMTQEEFQNALKETAP
jgi:hypothetical protein